MRLPDYLPLLFGWVFARKGTGNPNAKRPEYRLVKVVDIGPCNACSASIILTRTVRIGTGNGLRITTETDVRCNCDLADGNGC